MKVIVLTLIASLQIDLIHSSDLYWVEVFALADYVPDRTVASVLIVNSTVKTLNDCGADCSNNQDCSSFFYNSNSRTCLQYRTVFLSTSRLSDANGYRYYENEDVRCPLDDCFHRIRQVNLCLRMTSARKTYNESYRECLDLGSRLPVVNNKNKSEAVEALLKANIRGIESFFLGATQQQKSTTFTWLNGDPVYDSSEQWSMWLPRPKHSYEGCMVFVGHCVEASAVFGWDDVTCTAKQEYVVCEKRAT